MLTTSDIVHHYVVCATYDGRRVAFGPYDTAEQAVSMWVDVQALDVKTARVVSAANEKEAKDWL